jgi:hypothetical protein
MKIKIKKLIHRILTKEICDFTNYRFMEVWISLHLLDFINFWKRSGVNWAIKIVPKDHPANDRPWFHWWTPRWHEERGPYITMGIRRLRFYRGY